MNAYSGKNGFTLIEMILTLILCGLAAGMILPLFQSGFTSSTTPIFRLERVGELEACMANIIAAVRAPTSDGSTNPYQERDGGMDALKDAIENSETFSKWVPDGASITATTDGPYKLGTSRLRKWMTTTDQNYVLMVTLTDSEGASISYYFCEGSNYQTSDDDES